MDYRIEEDCVPILENVYGTATRILAVVENRMEMVHKDKKRQRKVRKSSLSGSAGPRQSPEVDLLSESESEPERELESESETVPETESEPESETQPETAVNSDAEDTLRKNLNSWVYNNDSVKRFRRSIFL